MVLSGASFAPSFGDTKTRLLRREETVLDQLKYPQWQQLLREAILEFDSDRLPAKVQRAEKAIYDRLHELPLETHDFDERQALTDGLATLEILRSEPTTSCEDL